MKKRQGEFDIKLGLSPLVNNELLQEEEIKEDAFYNGPA
tara:strand:+ start:7945 stop:8061 length:117 start_codon:yes stop_codon:yes gene_type:complete